MKKAVFFDIDGTLWDFHRVIPESTKEAVRMLRENGIYTFLCSGRTMSFITDPRLFELGFDGVLAGCGTQIEFHGEDLFYYAIPNELLEKTYQVLKKYDTPVVLEGKYYSYLEESDFADDFYVPIMKKEMGERLVSLLEHRGKWEASKITSVVMNEDYTKAIEELSDDYEFMIHGGRAFEGVPKGFSKASGIQMVCEKLGIAHEDTYAFGDSNNDTEMLQYVAHGIAMGNATEATKAAADYVTTDIHEDGIFLACKHFNLI